MRSAPGAASGGACWAGPTAYEVAVEMGLVDSLLHFAAVLCVVFGGVAEGLLMIAEGFWLWLC